jgi:hypothetical protein
MKELARRIVARRSRKPDREIRRNGRHSERSMKICLIGVESFAGGKPGGGRR